MHQQKIPKIAGTLATAMMVILPASSISGATPQFVVDNAHIAWNTHQPSWVCDDLSESGGSCHSPYPASYTSLDAPHYVQNPFTGEIFFYDQADGRDGGFRDPARFDRSNVWTANGGQGGQHRLSNAVLEDTYTSAGLFPRPDLLSSGQEGHYVPNGAFYETATNEYHLLEGIFDSGDFGSNTSNPTELSGVIVGTSQDGINFTQWDNLFWFVQPGGNGNGSLVLANKYEFIDDPTGSGFRWLGVFAVHKKNPDGSADSTHSGVTPVIVDWNQRLIGFRFENVTDWCWYPWGHEFNNFSATATCSTTGVNTSNTLPGDFVTSIPNLRFQLMSLSVINGQTLVLGRIPVSSRASDQCAGDATCLRTYADCPGFYSDAQKDLYVDRLGPGGAAADAFGNGVKYRVRELSAATWGSFSNGLSWTDNWKVIQDGGQAPVFSLNPTDHSAKGAYAELFQLNGGLIYLYLNTKRTFCEPDTAFERWNRFPVSGSGLAHLWYRLNIQ